MQVWLQLSLSNVHGKMAGVVTFPVVPGPGCCGAAKQSIHPNSTAQGTEQPPELWYECSQCCQRSPAQWLLPGTARVIPVLNTELGSEARPDSISWRQYRALCGWAGWSQNIVLCWAAGWLMAAGSVGTLVFFSLSRSEKVFSGFIYSRSYGN